MNFMLKSLCAAALFTASGAAMADEYVIDRSHAYVGFEINHLGFSTTLGQFTDYTAAISADWADPAASKVSFTIKAASIDTGWDKRDEHLRKPDFFDAEKFPTLDFTSTAVKVTGEHEADITGDLTMHGVTHPVTLHVTLTKKAPHPFNPSVEVVGISAHGTLKRSDWGITYAVPAVSDEVVLRVEAELNPAQ